MAWPEGIYVHTTGTVYFVDRTNNRIRSATSAGSVSLLAGSGTAGYQDGIGSNAMLNVPSHLTLDTVLGVFYVVEYGGNRVRKITTAGIIFKYRYYPPQLISIYTWVYQVW